MTCLLEILQQALAVGCATALSRVLYHPMQRRIFRSFDFWWEKAYTSFRTVISGDHQAANRLYQSIFFVCGFAGDNPTGSVDWASFRQIENIAAYLFES